MICVDTNVSAKMSNTIPAIAVANGCLLHLFLRLRYLLFEGEHGVIRFEEFIAMRK